jgi:hypothetical protein
LKKKEGQEAMRKRLLSVLILSTLLIMSLSIPALADSQNFTLNNETGVAIHELYIAPAGSDDWEEDVLDVDLLEDGESIEITFDETSEDFWDIKVVDENGDDIVWEKINLKETSAITLFYDGEKAWAEID